MTEETEVSKEVKFCVTSFISGHLKEDTYKPTSHLWRLGAVHKLHHTVFNIPPSYKSASKTITDRTTAYNKARRKHKKLKNKNKKIVPRQPYATRRKNDSANLADKQWV